MNKKIVILCIYFSIIKEKERVFRLLIVIGKGKKILNKKVIIR